MSGHRKEPVESPGNGWNWKRQSGMCEAVSGYRKPDFREAPDSAGSAGNLYPEASCLRGRVSKHYAEAYMHHRLRCSTTPGWIPEPY
mgnify:CR=1 FL=1